MIDDRGLASAARQLPEYQPSPEQRQVLRRSLVEAAASSPPRRRSTRARWIVAGAALAAAAIALLIVRGGDEPAAATRASVRASDGANFVHPIGSCRGAQLREVGGVLPAARGVH